MGAFLFGPVHAQKKQTKVKDKQKEQNSKKGIHKALNLMVWRSLLFLQQPNVKKPYHIALYFH